MAKRMTNVERENAIREFAPCAIEDAMDMLKHDVSLEVFTNFVRAQLRLGFGKRAKSWLEDIDRIAEEMTAAEWDNIQATWAKEGEKVVA